jgi:hypothetical protein
MFVGKAKRLLKNIAPKKGLLRSASAFLANIGLGWQGSPETNNLAYYEK